MDLLGLIPARGGSRGIPRKNLVPLGGRSLLARTIDHARESARLTRIAVSTDATEIANAARVLGVAVLPRPAELSTDATLMLDVVRHAVQETEAEAVVLLQPTSPFRTGAHIDAAIALWESTGADSVVSVVRVPHNFTPGSQLREDGESRLVPYTDGGGGSRQEKPMLYARNGPAVLVVSAETIRSGSLYGNDSRGYKMNALDSLDIDEPADLELAELLLRHR